MINITHPDGAQNKAAVFEAPESAIALICLPAMGVKATFYKRFAQCLCSQGFNVIVCDWRGAGSTSLRAGRGVDWGYQQLVDDVKDLVEVADTHFPGTRKFLIGHSLGGQISSLFAARYSEVVSGLILITTCSVHYKSWESRAAWRVFGAACKFYVISKTLGYFPGHKLGFAGLEAKTVMADWCHHALIGRYKLAGSRYDYDGALAALNLPVLAISIKDDELAGKSAVINFLNKLHPDVSLKYLHLKENETDIVPLNHFSWAKKPAYLVNIIKSWLQY
ncbi:alpha/beta fold hydrolase [Mucilaginibacter sp. Bleaf8]|uniref:alpha/beta hydrolase family protein n=1 Tax=Mucilaginibacter sp. Bleaf8 TaxID=2834430 RepID=UPI001BCF6374|nr:alpha/beta fold hydrolase [Mucilaginibacter sp. Bleaf8]MBS7563975.1 alpha/beta fold hydrolase [Mucilaginibacter sp. Bleaf8]